MNLKGQRFGRWFVTGPSERRGERRVTYWLCRCDCGNERFVAQGSLRRGHSHSCGCLRREIMAERQRIHGMYGTPTYTVWQSMKQRCQYQRKEGYEHYGGRGISVCERWQNSFQSFYDDMGPVPGPGYSIDRIDNDGNYTPENCHWATQAEQGRNMRTNHMLAHDGKTLCTAKWARNIGINYTTLLERLKRGWSVEEALTTPVLRRR